MTLTLVNLLINYLKQKYIGQYIREDGPQNHLSKEGTPTMGGIAMTAAVLISSAVVLSISNGYSLSNVLMLFIILGFGLLGFADDFLKVVKRKNKGISGWTKIFFQFLFAGSVTLFMFFYAQTSTISLFGLSEINLSYFYIALSIFIIIGSSNAINLTDGLDGLASSTAAISFLAMAIFLFFTSNEHLAFISLALCGSCIGFLVFNHHPAKIFMGDVGSLMLGGAFGCLGVLGNLDLWLVLLGIIFVVESLSVIIQVIGFKLTGRRIFKMAPIHHHFELSGDKETTIVSKFSLIQLLFCIIAVILGFKWLF